MLWLLAEMVGFVAYVLPFLLTSIIASLVAGLDKTGQIHRYISILIVNVSSGDELANLTMKRLLRVGLPHQRFSSSVSSQAWDILYRNPRARESFQACKILNVRDMEIDTGPPQYVQVLFDPCRTKTGDSLLYFTCSRLG